MVDLVVGCILAVVLIAVPTVLVRGVVGMYRDRDRTSTFSGGFASAMGEIDRLVRPSSEHLDQTRDAAWEHREDIGGD